MEDAPIQGEHEGVVESTSDADGVENVESVVGKSDKGKGVATEIPLLTRKAHWRSRKKKVHVHLKPVIERLDAQDLMKAQISTIAPPAPTPTVPASGSGPSGPRNEEAEVWPARPSVEEVRPLGPVDVENSGPGPKVVEESSQVAQEESGPPGPVVDEHSGSSEPMESQEESGRVEAPVEEAVPPEPPTSPLQTPAPPSPPSSTTAPLAPATFKQPLPKHISYHNLLFFYFLHIHSSSF
ncbi:hypothetical protein Taro_029796 [Colocasia esculenta]|uniref:Uncharacterized protein n=1 Tax=Colocasia esculenta TaxID=4460 RepID=A0A843VVZ0_COLES|nr:hypothetical protein [Colocasia esculenta]